MMLESSRIRLSKNDRPKAVKMQKIFIELHGGDNRDRTGDLSLARAALSQLSYIPKIAF